MIDTNKTMCIMAAVAAVVLGGASSALAQAPGAESHAFANISAGGQLNTSSFSSSSTFTSFRETGTVSSNQNIGRGFVFDATGGYLFTDHLGVGVGVWSANGKGAAAMTASLPDPVFVGRFTTVNMEASDLKQTNIGVNLQLVWKMALANRIDLAVSGGPTVIRARQDVATISVTPNTQTASQSIGKESKTTGKAGNAGVDVAYRITDRLGLGVFARYAGGSVDLPSAPKLKVGGAQLGGGVRLHF